MSDGQTPCPRCGTAVEPLQEYCLECGLRLQSPGLVPALATGWRRRVRWYPGDWIWPSLLALVVAIVAGGAAILWTRDAESAASETLVGDTTQLPTTVATVTPTTAGPSPTVPTTTARRTTTRRREEPRRLIEWPRRRAGWTLVLASLPTSSGRPAANAKARQAMAAGLRQVGVLDSSRYSSLHPGYYVVFSGIYASLGEAQNAASRAADAGYGNAYARRVTS
jgi:SPOR domain